MAHGYWANKMATGTSDEAVEARFEPAFWGTLLLKGDSPADLE